MSSPRSSSAAPSLSTTTSSDYDHTNSHDESRPLLSTDSPALYDPALEADLRDAAMRKSVTPLPKAQLACLCIVRLVDPIAFTQIFPYVNEMMADLHLTDDPSRIGFYSGIVESSFAIAQLFSIYQWAKLSDRIGRRPVIFTGILGMAVASILFGLSHTLTAVLFARCLAGLFSGNVAVIHSVLGELTDSSNQAIAFPIYGLTWPLGAIIGCVYSDSQSTDDRSPLHRPLIGGTFSNPATKFPQFFDYEFLRTYPYFLPGFIAAVTSVSGVVFGYFFLEETLPGKRTRSEKVPTSPDRESDSASSSLTLDVSEPATFRSLLNIPIIRALSLSGSALSFISTGFDVVFVLFCYSPIETGGLAFSASQIGLCLATSGAISVFIQIFLTPIILAKCDHIRAYNVCMAFWPYCFALLPFLNVIARAGLAEVQGGMFSGLPLSLDQADGRTQAMVWCGIAGLLGATRIACLSYSLSMILVKDSAPSPAALGTTNGLVQAAMCFTRAFAPALASSLFALSIDNNILGGYFWVVVMVAVSVAGTLVSKRIERGPKAAVAYD
ncbi:MFS general substrate transporter [Dentipellis sp. KUC8613]|nr:MFS general substrate transporter [Dentipellis sp. KUC8613]